MVDLFAGMGSAWKEYEEWVDEVDPEVKVAYDAASKILLAINKYENELVSV